MARGTLRTWCALAAGGTLAAAALGAIAYRTEAGAAQGPADPAAAPSELRGCRPGDLPPDPARPQIDCAAPPVTFDVTRYFSADSSPEAQAEAGPTFDAWAWASFAALNWPARPAPEPDPAGAFPSGFVRGVPDLDASFAAAADDDVLVWETFKEKRELFQPVDTPDAAKVNRESHWQAITFDPGQQPASPANPDGIPACAPAHAERAAALLAERGHHRIIAQGLKHPTAGGDETLDEIVEVASQAREPSSVLCAGYNDDPKVPPNIPTYHDCVTELFPDDSPSNPNALDERVPVGPRVWYGNPKEATARPVFFEVKVNWDFWRYILDRDLQLDTVAEKAALSAELAAHPKLPFRTASATGPGRSPEAVYGYDADEAVAGYRELADPDVLPGIGSVQLKAAWLMLDEDEIASRAFHTTEAIYFRSREPEKDPDLLCYEVDTFGLLALHIIQRIHSQPFDRRNPALYARSGTFVFATWEHASLAAEPSGYYYANYFAFPGPLAPLNETFPFTTDVTPFPNFAQAPGGAIPVVRQEPYPLDTTRAVTKAVHDQLPPESIWRNYRLIGTQFTPVGSETESMAYNQPYYLANLVVETNDGLQRFQGLPPGVFEPPAPPQSAVKNSISPYYTQKVDVRGTLFTFERDYENVIFNRELRNPVNMGGCMGCHGVAQLKGFNFSFVFADGQAGSDIDTQHHFAVAGGATPSDGGD